ncbi:MAG TPA: hypothetical protein VEA40_11165 [Ramlibacter sp.]|nr:hypothetical protein [Ramlibacter sp.]
MTAATSSILDLLLKLATAGGDPGNRFSVEGLTLAPQPDGGLQIGIRRLEAHALRLVSGPLSLDLGTVALDRLLAEVRTGDGRPRLASCTAAAAELSGVRLQGPLTRAASAVPAGAWTLEPLATAEGTLRSDIIDAHLLFDAQVTVPIRQGQVAFNDASVEHVGPDSRMGVSRLGLYVDAPNGRSYLYQFPSTPVGGVEYERRGAMLGPWAVTHRGRLWLQPFLEGVLGQLPRGQGVGLTEQARLLLARTSVAGELQLGDGRFAAPGVQAQLVGRADGGNRVRLHSQSVGQGVGVELPMLSVAKAVLGATLTLGQLTGSLKLQLSASGTELQFQLDAPHLQITNLGTQP